MKTREEIIKKTISLNPYIRIQCNDINRDNPRRKYNFFANPNRYTQKEFLSSDYAFGNEFLTEGIDNEELTEMRFDLDNKIFNDNVKDALIIDNKFKEHDLNINWFHSGGKGLHGSLMFEVKDINFLKHSNIKGNLTEFTKEVKELRTYNRNIKKGNNPQEPITPVKKQLDKRNIERTKLRFNLFKLIMVEDIKKIKEIDERLFGTYQLLTSIGYSKRTKTTNDKVSIKLPYNIHKNRNSKRLLDTFSFFTANHIHKQFISKLEALNDKLKESKKILKKQIKKDVVSYSERGEHNKKKKNNNKVICVSNVLIKLANRKQLITKDTGSVNYLRHCVRVLYSVTHDVEETVKQINYINEQLINSFRLNDDIRGTTRRTINRYKDSEPIISYYNKGLDRGFFKDEYYNLLVNEIKQHDTQNNER